MGQPLRQKFGFLALFLGTCAGLGDEGGPLPWPSFGEVGLLLENIARGFPRRGLVCRLRIFVGPVGRREGVLACRNHAMSLSSLHDQREGGVWWRAICTSSGDCLRVEPWQASQPHDFKKRLKCVGFTSCQWVPYACECYYHYY